MMKSISYFSVFQISTHWTHTKNKRICYQWARYFINIRSQNL